jgi:hypothetical protein
MQGSFAALGGDDVGMAGVGVAPAQVVLQGDRENMAAQRVMR